ncbi:amidohydrolase family protein [Clostridium sp. BNL1100]|uniref:amidohydrolase family protein n=1 Tax=Clostridium sp. BNL1100 TaxID=755731 RepID=UPI00024A7A65|nr:amidohydrolase family protein [Clostridium sp. BNL1100]AEY66123.1 putative TIM-barrel fold metal-dependent hydrolase [Clostridium sp. BNL1100]
MHKNWIRVATLLLVVTIIGLLYGYRQVIWPQTEKDSFNPEAVAEKAAEMRALTNSPSILQFVNTYQDLGIIDAHNHDASGLRYSSMMSTWDEYHIEKVVLFGDTSEPSAMNTDSIAWDVYQQYPDKFIPYFSGFDLHSAQSLDVIKNNLEKGYFGLGEIVAASTYSPMTSKAAWKGKHPMDGYLPQIYDLIAKYKAPILLHIDPANGEPIDKLEQALDEHPNTIFIFGHINAYNTPAEVERLMEKHPNLYADFFAGFSVYSPDSGNHPEEFIPVIKKYSDRFMLGTDSGYGIGGGEKKAIQAMYQILDLLDDPVVARKVAHTNLMNLIQAQPATQTQLKAIHELEQVTGKKYDAKRLTKLEAGQILAEAGKR